MQVVFLVEVLRDCFWLLASLQAFLSFESLDVVLNGTESVWFLWSHSEITKPVRTEVKHIQ